METSLAKKADLDFTEGALRDKADALQVAVELEKLHEGKVCYYS